MTRTILISVALAVLTSLAAAAPGEIPKFKSPLDLTKFKKAQKLFEKKHWKEAEKEFKALRKAVSGSEAKKLRVWIRGCSAGRKLAEVDKLIEKQKWKKAWTRVSKLVDDYSDTPLKKDLQRYESRIHEKLFYLVASFEKTSTPHEDDEYLGKYGRFNRKFKKHGQRSLVWRASPGNDGHPFKNLGGSLTGKLDKYKQLCFWVYSKDTVPGAYMVLLTSGFDELGYGGAAPQNSFYCSVNIKKAGWTEVRLDLQKSFRVKGEIELAQISSIDIVMTRNSKPKTIYLDAVQLEK